jgi:serine beta-lactamase-like protein LACTB
LVAKSWNRTETWVGLIVLGIGTIIAGVAGIFIYNSATATPLHPNVQEMPTVSRSDPPQQWRSAVEQARQIVRASVAEQNLPGLSVAVGVGNDIVWAEGFGLADIEKKTPVSPGTRFRIGTASVALTAAAAGLLIEDGRLRIDDEIQALVPEFPKKQAPITFRQVMAHTAGIRNDGGDEGPMFGRQCQRPVEALEEFADSDLRFDPGAQYRFSSYGWIVMSAAIEAAAQEPFLAFMQKRVFAPLGMDDTGADLNSGSMADMATAYFPRFAADPRYGPDPMREINLSCYAGASVFVSTPSDLVRFGQALNSGKLLKPDTVKLLQTPQRLPSGQDTGYGLGFDLETADVEGRQTQVVGHDGDVLGGTVSSLMMFPDGMVIALISNTSYADTFAIGSKIAPVFVNNDQP